MRIKLVDKVTIEKLSSKMIPIYIATKYAYNILENKFLSNKEDYRNIAISEHITTSDLYKLLALKSPLHHLEKNEEKIKYIPYNILTALAYYSQFHSINTAKTVFNRLLKLQHKKKWDKIKQIFTPLFYNNDFGGNFLLVESKFIKSNKIIWTLIKQKSKFAECLDQSLFYPYVENINQILTREQRVELKEQFRAGKKVVILATKQSPYINEAKTILKIEVK